MIVYTAEEQAAQYRSARRYTCHLWDIMDEGWPDKDTVIMACLKYMSEADVQDMMELNEFVRPDELDEEEEEHDEDEE